MIADGHPSVTEALNALPGLGKWPAVSVRGNPITKDQALGILLRTIPWSYCSTNARDRLEEIGRVIFGPDVDLTCRVPGDGPGYRDFDVAMSRYLYDVLMPAVGSLDIEYFRNERICSSWVGGPNGWVDWDGNIRMDKNIGKWPSWESIAAELEKIASAFPFLSMRVKVYRDEPGYDSDTKHDIPPEFAAGFLVHAGDVELLTEADVKDIEHSPSYGLDAFVFCIQVPSSIREFPPLIDTYAVELRDFIARSGIVIPPFVREDFAVKRG